jgi:hypothetical protein
VKFEIVCEQQLVDQLATMTEVHAEQARRWWDERLQAAQAIEHATDRRQALAELRQERDRRRAAGEHFDTCSAIVTHYVLADLDRRGWRTRHLATRPGRWRGRGRPRRGCGPRRGGRTVRTLGRAPRAGCPARRR